MPVYKDEMKTKDGRCWYYKIRKNGKQCKSKRYLTKKEAQEAEALHVIKINNAKNKTFYCSGNQKFTVRIITIDFYRIGRVCAGKNCGGFGINGAG